MATSAHSIAVKVFVTGAAKGARDIRGVGTAGKTAAGGLSSATVALAGLATGAGIAAGVMTKIAATLGSWYLETSRLANVQREAEAQVASAIRSTGDAAGYTLDQLKKMASEMQGRSIFGDETILRAQAIGLTFTRITDETFPRFMQSVIDVSARMDQDLKTSVVQLGKALNDPVANLGALSRTGIQFTAEQKATIKSMAEMNNLAGAQAVILEELETQFGGAAEAQAEAGGQTKQLKNAWGDLLETIGMTAQAWEPLIKLATQWITKLNEAVVASGRLFQATAGVASGLADFAKVIENVSRILGQTFLGFSKLSVLMPASAKAFGEAADALLFVSRRAGETNEALERGAATSWLAYQRAISDAGDAAGKAGKQLENVPPPGQAKALQEVTGFLKSYKTAIEEQIEAIERQQVADKQAHEERLQHISDVLEAQENLADEIDDMAGQRDEVVRFFEAYLEGADQITDAFELTTAEIDRMSAEVDQIDIDRLIDGFIAWGDVAAQVFRGMDRGLANLAGSIANVAAGMQQIRQLQGAYEAGDISRGQRMAGGAAAGAQTGSDVFARGKEFGFWEGDRGSSQFGGRMSGDYADMGASIGGSIGGGIPVFGEWGALVGSIIGAVVGGFIKKGADEGLAQIRDAGDQIMLQVTKDQGGLGNVVADIGNAIISTVGNAVGALGGQIDYFKEFDLKVRDNLATIFIDGMTKRSEDVDELILFAVNKVFSGSSYTGLSANAQAVLGSGQFASLEQLQYAIEIVNQVDALGEALRSSEFERGIRNAHDELLALADAIEGLGGSAEDVYATIGDNLKKQFDAFRGIAESEGDKIRRQAEELNRERQRMIDEMTARMLEMQDSAGESLGVVGDVVGDFLGQLAEGAEVSKPALQSMLETFENMAASTGEVSAEMQAQIDAIRAVIDTLPDAISEEEIEQAVNRQTGGGGGGRDGRRFWEGERQFVRDVAARGLDEVARIQRDYAAALDEVQRRGRLAHSTMEELAAAEAQLASERDDALRAIGESSLAALSPLAGLTFQMRDLAEDIAFLSDNAEALGFTLQDVDAAVRAFGDLRFGDIAGELAGIIGDEQLLAELRKAEQLARIAYLEFEATRLYEMGALSEEQFKRIVDLAQRAMDAIDEAEKDTSGAGLRGTGDKRNVTRPGAPDRGVLDRIGLPLRSLRQEFTALAQDLRYLEENADRLGLSAANVANIFRRIGEAHYLDVGSRLAEMTGNQDALLEFQNLRHQMELAQIRVQIDMMERLGLVSEEQLARLNELYEEASNLDFSGGGTGPDGGPPVYSSGYAINPLTGARFGNISGGQDAVDAWQERMNAAFAKLLDLERQASSGTPLEETIAGISAEFEELQTVLGKHERITKLWVEAIAEAIDEFQQQIDEFQRGLLADERLSPLKLRDRYNLAVSSFEDAIGEGDIEAAMRRAQELLQLGLEVFPKGASSYQDLFRSVNEALDTLQQQIYDDAVAAAGQKIDTTALELELQESRRRQMEADERASRQMTDQTNVLRSIDRKLASGGGIF